MEKEVFTCSLCQKTFYGMFGACYNIDNESRVYCKECSKDVENMSRLPEVMIVPTTPLSFDFIQKNKLYFHPMNYGRKGGRYIAFYISQPTSAITHIAKVKHILRDQNPKKYLTDVNFEKGLKSIKIYFLEPLKKLQKPIKRVLNEGAIQGTQNTTLDKIKKAKSIGDLIKK